MSFRASDNDSLLLEEHTLAFRLTPACERGAGMLGIPAGRRVRVELVDDGGHLLDSRTYLVASREGSAAPTGVNSREV
jgi:hypothetical protein